MQYGYVIYPFTYNETRKIEKQLSFGFFIDLTPKVLYVNATRFDDDYMDDPVNSPLNIVSHELLHSLSFTNPIQYDILLSAVDHIDLKSFILSSENNQPITDIYGPETNLDNEYIHRYIANNKSTSPLLKNLFYKTAYTPPPRFKKLYLFLSSTLDDLKNRKI